MSGPGGTKGRVVVTGAAGFVGRSIARGLVNLGWDVCGADKTFDDGWSSIGAESFVADLTQPWPPDLPDADVVIHAAWITSAPSNLGLTNAEYASLNLRPLLLALEYSTRVNAGAFVFLSSTGVFSAEDGRGPLTDADLPTSPSPYAATKRAAEQLVPAGVGPATRPYVIRLGYLFGPDETPRPTRASLSQVAQWLSAARSGEPLVVRSDDPEREWTFAPDLASAVDRLVKGTAPGHPVHLGSPHIRRDSSMAEAIASLYDEVGLDRTGEVPGPMKAPMAPSALPALAGFEWTTPEEGLRATMREEALA